MFNGVVSLLTAFFSVHQFVLHADLHDERSAISERVQNYLAALNSTNWLENSNKIGVGYNPLYGSPVCYTGSCQMEGFTRSIFKLNYLQPASGSCTNKLIPEHVELDCLPSTTWDASTEIISTLQELHESITNIVDVSVSAEIEPVLFSYTTSVETRYMVDNIIQKETTATQTTAQISYVKLSMFEPQMELSDDFIYVISNLPCCDYDSDIEHYIYEYVFNYFGFTFLSDILLGGIAQETLLIKKQSYDTMITEGYDIGNQAKVEFYASISASQQYNYDKTTHDRFMSEVQEKHTTTLGGDTSLTTIDNWSTTVPSNPVIIKFSIRNIFVLLNQHRFPNDSLIQNKSALIAQALNNYIIKPVYCYNDCSGHGNCVPSSYFQFGICDCTGGYSGFDCSVQPLPVTAPPPQATQKPVVYSGTMSIFYGVQFAILQLFMFVFI